MSIVGSTKKNRVTMFPLAEAKPSDSVNYRIVTATCDASVTLRITDDPDAALTMARVIVRPESAREADERRREQERQRKIERSTPMADLSPPVILPDKERVVTTGGPVFLDIAHGWFEQSELFLAFDALNDGAPSRRIAQVLAYDRSGAPLPIDVSHIQNAGPTDENVLANVPGKSRARGFISLPGAADGDIRGLTIMLLGDDGSTLATASVGDWDSRRQILVPMSDEEIERQKRDEEARGQVSVHLRAMRGVIWLEDGTMLDEPEATVFNGFGARATYGFNRHIAIEAEFVGASSNSARFENVMLNGEEGDLERTASLARVHVGGVLRIGDKTLPTLRLGVGLQASDLDSIFTADGGSMLEPDSSLDVNGFWYFGLGVDRWFGDRVIVGVHFGSVFFGDRAESVDAGAHFGYAWKP